MKEPWRAAEAQHNEKLLAKGQLQQQLKGSCREAEAKTMRSPGEVQVQPNCSRPQCFGEPAPQKNHQGQQQEWRQPAPRRQAVCAGEGGATWGGGAPEMVSESYALALLIYTSGLVLVQL